MIIQDQTVLPCKKVPSKVARMELCVHCLKYFTIYHTCSIPQVLDLSNNCLERIKTERCLGPALRRLDLTCNPFCNAPQELRITTYESSPSTCVLCVSSGKRDRSLSSTWARRALCRTFSSAMRSPAGRRGSTFVFGKGYKADRRDNRLNSAFPPGI